MAISMMVPLVASALLGLFAPVIGRRLPPATAVRWLVAAMFVVTAALWYALAVIGLFALAHISLFADLGHYSKRLIGAGLPVPIGVAALSPLLLFGLMGAAFFRVVLGVRDLARAAIACRRMGPAVEGLVVVDQQEPDAYAVAGIRGRVVISTAMMQALPAEERRVLLAHEAAHLSKRHHLWIQAGQIAAAANPLLRPASRAINAMVERWADEIAAAEVGDRELAARALARAGLARSTSVRTTATAAALSAARHSVADRARALLAGPPPPRRAVVAVLTALMISVVGASAVTTVETVQQFRAAHTAYSTNH
jgi:Zn-dependent protease with chaperone function